MIPLSVLRELSRSERVPESSRRRFEEALRDPAVETFARRVTPRPTKVSVRSVRPAIAALIFDCSRSEALPGKHVLSPAVSGDATVSFVDLNLSQLLEFFQACFGRISLDGRGLSVLASVHYGNHYPNAYWNGYGLVFGDGDGLIFRSMASSDDFIGHEFMHGVTQYASALEYSGEAGALNESFSDIFGSLFRQWRASQTATVADWMIGSGLMGPVAISNGWQCLRSLKSPGAAYSLSKQPWHYDEYIQGGGPHDNSGIPNHAFFLVCQKLGGYCWEVAGAIWYRVLISVNDPNIGFVDFAHETYKKSEELFPHNASIARSVKESWREVGVSF